MPLTGTLRSWHDDRGFGFIAPTHGGPELFVHISAFPNDGSRPTIGETLSYELGRGSNGKPQAVKVVRTAIGTRSSAPRSSPAAAAPRRHPGSWLSTLLGFALVAGLAGYGYKSYQERAHRRTLEQTPVSTEHEAKPAPLISPPSSQTYRCDGRTHCSQMTSCSEAKWFINNCPGTAMDSDGDGEPCEQQWCKGLGAR